MGLGEHIALSLPRNEILRLPEQARGRTTTGALLHTLIMKKWNDFPANTPPLLSKVSSQVLMKKQCTE